MPLSLTMNETLKMALMVAAHLNAEVILSGGDSVAIGI